MFSRALFFFFLLLCVLSLSSTHSQESSFGLSVSGAVESSDGIRNDGREDSEDRHSVDQTGFNQVEAENEMRNPVVRTEGSEKEEEKTIERPDIAEEQSHFEDITLVDGKKRDDKMLVFELDVGVQQTYHEVKEESVLEIVESMKKQESSAVQPFVDSLQIFKKEIQLSDVVAADSKKPAEKQQTSESAEIGLESAVIMNNENLGYGEHAVSASDPLPESIEVEKKVIDAKLNDWITRGSDLRSKGDYESVLQAIEYFEAAVSYNSTEALDALGEIYLYGEGEMDSNITMAVHFLTLSSKLGSPTAQYYLGFFHSIGYGLPQDDALAILYLYFAAIHDNIGAKLMLGYRHMFGFGVPRVCATAASYYESVAEHVKLDLDRQSNQLLEKQRLSEENSALTLFSQLFGAEMLAGAPAQEEQVANFYRHSAHQGDAQAQAAVGQLHYFGAKGVQRDLQQARQYFEMAAKQGDVTALTSLGNMYVHGEGVPVNNELAFSYFQKAADRGSVTAFVGLGYMHLNGLGVPKDTQLAIQFFKKAADAGSADAQFNLASLYYNGLGVPVDLDAALHYFTLSAQQGHTRAIYTLAQMHMHGIGTPKSCPIALKLYKIVAEKGNWTADLKHAFLAHHAGNDVKAFLLYAQNAEKGFEIAQHNAAWLLEHGLVRTETNPEFFKTRFASAFRLWSRSAEQGSNEALRIIGDYYYYNKVADFLNHDGMNETSSIDFEAAAQSYLAASALKNAQAMYNVGFMYEYGLGVRRDMHLAKRYYDMSLSTDLRGYLPVKIAQIRVWIQLNWDETIAPFFSHFGFGSSPNDINSAGGIKGSVIKTPTPKAVDSNSKKVDNTRSEFSEELEELGQLWSEIDAFFVEIFQEFFGDWMRMWEDILILLCVFILGLLVYYRRAHI